MAISFNNAVPMVSSTELKGVKYFLSDDEAREIIKQLDSRLIELESVPVYDTVLVTELPEASIDTLHQIYLIPSNNAAPDEYLEFITIRKVVDDAEVYSWERVGSTKADLTGLLNEQDAKNIIEELGLVTDVALSNNNEAFTVEGITARVETENPHRLVLNAASTSNAVTSASLSVTKYLGLYSEYVLPKESLLFISLNNGLPSESVSCTCFTVIVLFIIDE